MLVTVNESVDAKSALSYKSQHRLLNPKKQKYF